MKVLYRADWSAKPPKRTKPFNRVNGFAVHYVGSKVGKDSAAVARALQQQAFNEGYSDIEYNWLVALDGTALEGRGWNVQSGANGVTAGNSANAHYIAICFLMGPNDQLTDAAKTTFNLLLASGKGHHSFADEVWPHSHFVATACPGDAVRNWINAGHPNPNPPPPPPPKVKPMYSPALDLEPIAADLGSPDGGAWLLAPSGAVYAFGGAKFYGSANNQPYFKGRTAARLELPNSTEKKAKKKYTIVATTGERYAYP